MVKKVLPILFVLFLVSCSQSEDNTIRPVETWLVSSPADQGMDITLLDKALQRLDSKLYGKVDRFLLVRRGYLVVDRRYEFDYDQLNEGRDAESHPYNYYDSSWHPYYQGSDLHTLQSTTKSVVSILLGIAIGRGELPDSNPPVLDYFEGFEVDNLDERKQQIRLEDLLTMRSGLAWDEWSYPVGDPRNSVTQMEMSEDWIQFALDLPMEHDPGDVFVYNSGASQLLSVIVKEATGMHIDAFAEATLFKPLGISDYFWKKTPGGWPDTEGGLYLKAEDLAKIGYLVLQGGEWGGKQLIPEWWVDEMTSPKVADVDPNDPDWNDGYGYQWWLLGERSQEDLQIYAGLGYGGQFLFVVPELDLVGVFYGWNVYGTRSTLVIDLFVDNILPAAKRE